MHTFNVPTFHTGNGAPVGTLIGVTYDISLRTYGNSSQANTSFAESLTLQLNRLESNLIVVPPGGADTLLVDTDQRDPGANPLIPSQTVLTVNDSNLGGTDERSFFFNQTDTETLTVPPNAGTLLTLATGAGTLAWNLNGVSTYSTAKSGGNLSADVDEFADFTLTVTYIYNEIPTGVPEASTWVAMAPLAAFGAWAMRRRMVAARA